MAASSPALSNTSTDTAATNMSTPTRTVSTAAITSNATIAAAMSPNQPKTLRGLNKPKCIRCGNVARSRCPYQSCKNCCAKAQNPCVIHVLKANATFPEKTTSSSPLEQRSTEVPSSGSAHRVPSFKQLSNNFSQFNNVQFPLRSRKPLTRKEAAAINEWRFSKLKEYKDGNIEHENEAFDRYMQNISLLEEVFSIESTSEENTENAPHEDDRKLLISELKVKLRSNPVRSSNFKNSIQEVVNNGLEKLQKRMFNDDSSDSDNQNELIKRSKKKMRERNERALILTELNEKLSKARNEEDLKACIELKSILSNLHTKTSKNETENTDILEEQIASKVLVPKQESHFYLPKLFSTKEVDDFTLNCVDVHFTTLELIEDL